MLSGVLIGVAAALVAMVALQPRYLAGLGIDGLAWLCGVVALRFVPARSPHERPRRG